jgi:RNA polymerase sigma factor (sigma-70 family)
MAADHAYIDRLKTDREKCLEELYLKYRHDFTEWAGHKFSIETEEAEDIFQDSLIIFYENVLSGRLTTLSSSLRTYLFAIGKHKILKNKKKLPLYANVDDVPDINLIDDSLEDLANTEEKHKAVHSALRLLGPDCQKILEMFYFEGCNLTTVAKALNYKNENVAKVKKASCMRKLSGFMKGNNS